MRYPQTFFVLVLVASKISAFTVADPAISNGRQADPTAKAISDIRAAERRRIPLDVQLKSADRYSVGGPVYVTIIVTNLFDSPLIMNSRMLVNHPLLQGEVSFRITGPDGQKVEIQRLITPLSVRDHDFVLLHRGESMQREVDLTDLYGIVQKGTYQVQVSYHNEVDGRMGSKERSWKGVVWSEPTEINLD